MDKWCCCCWKNASASPESEKKSARATSNDNQPSQSTGAPSSDNGDECCFKELVRLLQSLARNDIDHLIKFLESEKTTNTIPPALTDQSFLKQGWCWVETQVLVNKDRDLPKFVAEVLKEVGASHWVLLGLFVAGVALDRYVTVGSNETKCRQLLHMMNITVTTLKDLRNHSFGGSTKAIELAMTIVVENCKMCCDYLSGRSFQKLWKAKPMEEQIKEAGQLLNNVMGLVTVEDDLRILNAFKELGKSLKEASSYYVMPTDKLLECSPVGLDERSGSELLRIDGRDENAVAVIIWGLGGIGKSTLASASIQQLHSSLQNFKYSRVEFDNTIQNGRPSHIAKLQEQIANNLTGQERKCGDPTTGRSMLKEILEDTSSFLFIDNVENAGDVEELLPRELSLKDGVILRILIASREGQLKTAIPRNCKLEDYPMQPLSSEAGFDLLKKELLDPDTDKHIESFDGETQKLEKIAELCGGIPLLLKVIAKQLQEDRCLECYDEVIEKLQDGKLLQESYYEKANAVISFVFKKLRNDLQDTFVELCVCFLDERFFGWDEVFDIVRQRQMNALMRKGLISKGENGGVAVHDILRKIALNEGREFYIRDKREWDETSKNAEKLKTVRWIKISPKQPAKAVVEAKQLDSTCKSLEVLCLEGDIKVMGQCQLAFNRLRVLYMITPKTLEAFPFKDISSFTNLRFLLLVNQSIEIPVEIWSLQSLSHLELRGCQGLRGMPEHVGKLKKLKQLTIVDCPIIDLPQNFSGLASLETCTLAMNKLKRLPSDFGHGLKELKKLQIINPIEELPESFTKLTSLKFCRLRAIFISHLPEDIGNLSALETLYLHGKNISELPKSFGSLRNLETLMLTGMKRLRELPDSFVSLSKLKVLQLSGCEAMEETAIDKVFQLQNLRSLFIYGSRRLIGRCKYLRKPAQLRIECRDEERLYF